ncbi:MAG: amidohydrolase family protein [Planctomycetia bacterium]|nr:amidohydrolase family protein [Planctomycetia bacterium]
MIRWTRRRFVAAAAISPWLAQRAAQALAVEPPARPARERAPTLDIHIHLMGAGDDRSGCVVSQAVQKGPLFKLLVEKLQLRDKAPTLDQAFVQTLAGQLKDSGVDKGVVLAQDAVYDAQGRPDWRKTHVYVPNDYLLKVVAQYSDLMVPCVSINPARADALDELNRCLEKGVRVLKIHPPIQGVDIAERKHRGFFRRCAEKKVLVMVHTGHEHSAPVVDIELARPEKLRPALDEGCTVVACHSGTGREHDRPDMLQEFFRLLRDYEKQGNLWGDTAVLGSYGRTRDFARLLADDLAKSRLLHGSDFPFPAIPLGFAGTIGATKAAVLQLEKNLIRQDFALKEALGIGRASAEQAYRLVVGK